MSGPLRTHRPGMTLVELLIGMVVALLILQGAIGVFIGQSKVFGEQNSIRSAREAARGALQILTSDLRRTERSGGVESASATAIVVRVPVAMGVVCARSATAATVSMLPVDSVQLAVSEVSGYAWRTADGSYTYSPGGSWSTTSAAGDCSAESIQTLPAGTVITVSPAPDSTAYVSAPILLYQRVRYEFRPSTAGYALIRTLLETGQEELLVEPFETAGTRFRFFTDPAAPATDAPPADLSDLTGLELVLQGLGDRPRPDGAAPAVVPLTAAVFFRN